MFLQSSLVQSRHILIHQVVDGIVPEGVLAAVSLDLCAVGLALLEALDGISGAGALIDRIGGGLQFLSRSAEGHFADTLFRSFHAYQFHRIYPPCCSLGGGAALQGSSQNAILGTFSNINKVIIAQVQQKRYNKLDKNVPFWQFLSIQTGKKRVLRQQLPRKSGKTLRKGRLSPMRLFDVLGPVMIGPSSSHTAGAAKIGYTAQKLLGEVPAQADIGLYGSFATTGKGHGTDRALVAGLLGLRPDDPRLPDSFVLAAQQGMQFSIHPVELRSAHPNTAVLTLTSRTGRQLSLKAASVGGGRIRVTEIDGVPADFGGDSNTLIIHNEDTPGCIAEVTMALALRRINIASMQVFRAAAGGYAVMVLECDSHIPHALERQLAVMPGLLKVTCLNVDEPEETEE